MNSKRKNQEILDFIDELRQGLGETNPKNYGLYMKFYKKLGKANMRRAFYASVRRPAQDKIRYFLGILWRMAREKETLKKYRKLRSPLLKRMTPFARAPKTRSRLQVRISHQERKMRR